MPDEKNTKIPNRGVNFKESALEPLPPGNSWFIGIGINKYQHFPHLSNAVKDVEDLAVVLQEQYGLEPGFMVILFDEEATRRNVILAFDRLMEEVQPQDKLLIYYSGHGHLARTGNNKKGFWIPTDAEKDNTSQYIRNSTIRDYIEDIDALHTLLISDSCFSGSLFVRGGNRSDEAAADLELRRSRWALCSGRHDEEVYDGVPGTNSPFAESILDVLRSNQLPKLNVAKLADRVIELTRANYKQLPEGNPLYGVGHRGGQYIFRLRTADSVFWEKSKALHTIAAYGAYLKQYPQGQYAEEALEQIESLEEGRAWKKALQSNRYTAYYRYLRQYPRGRFRKEAHHKIELLEKGNTSEFTGLQQMPEGLPGARSGKRKEDSRKHQSAYGYFTDSRDGKVYRTLEIGGKAWMAQNLDYRLEAGSWNYENIAEADKQYGSLYTWEAALRACPPGWRLPEDEDWKNLALQFGGYYDWEQGKEAGASAQAFDALTAVGSPAFSALFAGRHEPDGNVYAPGQIGIYWTATEFSRDGAWVYTFSRNRRQVGRGYNPKTFGFSCRCIKAS